MKYVGTIAAAAAGMWAIFILADVALWFGRPPQPLPLGTIQWFYETGATVDSVQRVAQIGLGPHALRAKGVSISYMRAFSRHSASVRSGTIATSW